MIKSTLLFFWMVSTLILTFTVVGMLLFIPDIYYSNPDPTTWMEMGLWLTEKNPNKTQNTILFLFWILFTIILTCSVFGMLLFIPNSSYRSSTWMEIGKKLATSI
jgi:hypothetical protein